MNTKTDYHVNKYYEVISINRLLSKQNFFLKKISFNAFFYLFVIIERFFNISIFLSPFLFDDNLFNPSLFISSKTLKSGKPI